MSRVSRWHFAYTLAILATPFAAWDAAWIIRYWPVITSFTNEVLQCVAGSH
jgi:hypothetical protein